MPLTRSPPAGLSIEDPAVRPQLRRALLAAEQRLDDANIALMQHGRDPVRQRNDAKIPFGEG